jgi:hypothetical protein
VFLSLTIPLGRSEKDLQELREDGKKKKKYIKPGESREPKPILVAPVGPDGRVRHMVSIDEKLVQKEELAMQVGPMSLFVCLFVGVCL